MSGIATAVVGSAVIGGVVASRSASKAAKAQTAASEAGIDEEQRQFDLVQELLQPYVEAGVGREATDETPGITGSLQAQQDLLGLNGPEAQQSAIDNIKNSPEFTGLIKTGEEAILQNASATGDLRGGNTKEALGRYRPELLSKLIQERFQNLGSLTNIGQASAAGTGAAAQQTGANIASLYGDIGAAQAGRALAQGQAIGGVAQTVGDLALLKKLKAF